HEAGGFGAIGDAVVGGDGSLHDGADGQLAVAHYGRRSGRAYRQNGRLGRVDDGDEVFHVEGAQVADGEGATLHVVRSHLAFAGAGDHLFVVLRNLRQG